MRKLNQKQCAVCRTTYQPTGSCSKYCEKCRPEQTRLIRNAAVVRWAFKMGRRNGKGSGSSTGTGKDNHMYKHGGLTFKRWAREKKGALGKCENCDKDLSNAVWHEWVGHHKDHNPLNNIQENLQILCKRCHQIEHKCWKAFEGVTTIPKGSRLDN